MRKSRLNPGGVQALTSPNGYWPGESQLLGLEEVPMEGLEWRWDSEVRGAQCTEATYPLCIGDLWQLRNGKANLSSIVKGFECKGV